MLSFLLLTLSLTGEAQPMEQTDSTQISLLTCSPGEEIWAQYGHTAIRYKDSSTGQDIAINYGIFSSEQPYFIPRFILGMTDYRMGIEPMDMFLAQYSYEGRGVTEQVLNLTAEDKKLIKAALDKNARPENIVYRYNFFYDNCTSRARDMIVNHLHGKIVYPAPLANATFRSMIHTWNNDYKWAQFGEDLLLGIKADQHTTKAEQQFLPDNLQRDFEKAIYNGKPLVMSTRQLIAPQDRVQKNDFILSPVDCALIFAILSITILLIEYKRKTIYWIWDAILMLLSGLTGIILFIMLFSQHPCVSVNVILCFFNPLPLFFLCRTIKKTKRHDKDNWWTIWEIMIILGFIGGFFQHIPVPVLIVALFLLLNCMLHQWIYHPLKAVTVKGD